MREIKFRAWNIDNSMYYYLDLDDLTNSSWGIIYTKSGPLDIYDKFVFEQYTGLKDKNGVEIYEGDILKWVAYGVPMEEFKELSSTNRLSVRWYGCGFDIPYEDESNRVYEVIGNIHKNPELLNG